MKRITAIITLVLMLTALLCACKKNVPAPTASPNVPVVSETPAVPSPDMSASPNVSPKVSPSASPTKK